MKKLKIGFFGGSFNPPTDIHISLANELLSNKMLDKIIFVPVGDYYQKKNLIPAIHRYNMLKLATNKTKNMEVENIAIKHKETLFATDTLKLIYDKYYKEADIYFIMGMDNFEKMPTWKDYEKLINKYKFIVIERLKYNNNNNLENIIYYKNNHQKDISSTIIRNKIQEGKDVSKYIDVQVLKYIQENKLYNA